MKRTTLVLDEELLESVTRLYGEKSYSAAVNRSMEESLRQAKVRDLWSLAGSGAWEGDLSEMRGDRGARRLRRRRRES